MIIKAIHRLHWLRASLLACGLAVTATAPAQTLDFGSCVRIEDLSVRLACYDRAAGRASAAAAPATSTAVPAAPPVLQAPPAPLPVIPAPAARAPVPPQQPLIAPEMPRDPVASFGSNSEMPDALSAKKLQSETKELNKIEARVTAVRTRPAGEQVITLDNGQVWTQTEVRRGPQFAVDDVVVIKRGVLGSFLLTLQKGSASTRVRRIS